VSLCVCAIPVFGVCDGIDYGIVDGGGLGDHGRHRVHVGSQHISIPDTEEEKEETEMETKEEEEKEEKETMSRQLKIVISIV